MARLSVGIADLKVSASPDTIMSVGLGSCVGITLYDSKLKIGGLVHVLLPCSTDFSGGELVREKFADTGIVVLLEKVLAKGADRSRLVAKMAGGANMFPALSRPSAVSIGERNVEVSTNTLKSLGIKIVSSDTGGNFGRTLELDTATGMLSVKTVGYGTKDI